MQDFRRRPPDLIACCSGEAANTMPPSPQKIAADIIELSSDEDDSSQEKRAWQIEHVGKHTVKEENPWISLHCKAEPEEYPIPCQFPLVTLPKLRDPPMGVKTESDDFVSKELASLLSEGVGTNSMTLSMGCGSSLPGLLLNGSGLCVVGSDGNVIQNCNGQEENPSPAFTSGHDPSNMQAHQDHFRTFWKAGEYAVSSSPGLSSAKGQMERVSVHPKFLHSNATSHKWAFGAIAELLDNAVDEIQNGATFVKIDKMQTKRDNSPALVFHDNGGGMNPECIRLCMSLGYSSKKTNTTIGQYGNGFKTSTMRLGADAIVFSRTNYKGSLTESIGLLSYTFLRKTGQNDIVVPMVDFEISSGHARPMILSSLDDWRNDMNILLEWSPFCSEEELMQQFEDIGVHGTKVIIFNLWLNEGGFLELDFDVDKEPGKAEDIRLRDASTLEGLSKSRSKEESHISHHIRHSLRAYASILYLRRLENFQIILRGKPVEQHDLANDMKFVEVATYKPQLGFQAKEVAITLGFVKEDIVGIHGFNVYHKNRLIMPFWKVIHTSGSDGRGVVGFFEANFMEPAHDKQDFERTAIFIRVEARLKKITYDYWKRTCHLAGYKHRGSSAPQSVIGLAAPAPTVRSPRPRVNDVIKTKLRGGLGRCHVDGQAMPASRIVGGPSPVIHDAAKSGSLVGGSRHSVKTEALVGGSGSDPLSIDRLCEENVQLFMRCEQHRKRQSELKLQIEKLERELSLAKRKSALLSEMEVQ